MQSFLKDHLNDQLNLNNGELELEKWTAGKEIIISLNKKDLLDETKSDLLNKKLNLNEKFLNGSLSVNKISCIDDRKNEIYELLDQLKGKVSNLYDLNFFWTVSFKVFFQHKKH